MLHLFRLTLSCLTVFAGLSMLQAQSESIQITGTVIEAGNGLPVPFATVAVIQEPSKTILTGVTTDSDGAFSINSTTPNFYIEISFIGFQKKEIRDFQIANGKVDLGTIVMETDSEVLQEVEITAEKSMTEFKLDRRVFNVGQDISTTGMGALEVLNNVPSVNVDIEGQISLRGNSGVQVLINGKPSILTDSESNALGTITADMIESVEVITNPSAKYEAEGTAGIINIVLKKEEKKGVNGSVSLNTGIPDNHSIGFSLNRRTEKFNMFTQIGAGYRSMPRNTQTENTDFITGESVYSDGDEYRNENFYNITLGTDYYINQYNTVTLSGNFAYELEQQPSEFQFEKYDGDGVLLNKWRRDETTEATNPKWQYDLQYEKQFRENEDHVLLFSTQGSFFGKELSSEFVNTEEIGNDANTFQTTESDYSQADYVVKIDYTKPIGEFITFETGGQYEINDVQNDYGVFNQINGELRPDSNLTNNFEYDQQVLGAYVTGAYEGKVWGLKAGLRVEQTNLKTLLTNTDEKNTQNYANLFPSVHASYKFSKRISAQLGYSRRIYRPRLWDLNPFFNIRNNFNISKGNPNLQPQFSDSYELTAIFIYEKLSLNVGVFNLYTTDVIERIVTSVDNVSIRMPENIGTNNSTGFELNAKYTPIKSLTITGDFNYNYFIRRGSFEDQNFDFNGQQWTAKLTTKLKLPADFDFEVTGNFNSSVENIQGETAGFAFMDVGVRKKLWKGKAIVNFSIRDVFATRLREYTVEEPTFYQFSSSMRGTFYTLGVSFGFGKGEAMTYGGKGHR